MRSDDQPRFPNGNGYRTRPRAAFGALLGLLLAALVSVPSCLNPRPEEEPSVLVDPAPVGVEPDGRAQGGPVRETCEDNSLLAGCEATPPVDAPANDPAPAPGGAQEEPGVEAPEDTEGPGAGDAGAADAGANAPGSSVVD